MRNMKGISTKVLLLALLLVPFCFGDSGFNPYSVLNVQKSATTSDIRKAYKKLVREWHPDKNDSPDAQDKFIQIQQAYEVLSNEEKRNDYDSNGFASENNQPWSHAPHNFRQHFKFSDFFGSDFYNNDFGQDTSSRSVSNYKFFKHVLPNSHQVPQILYVYSTFSAQCIVILKSSWEKAARDLEKLGLGVGTVDTTFTRKIASNLRVTRLPTVVVIFQEHYSYFQGVITYENLKQHVTSQLPSYLVKTVTYSTVGSFLNGVENDDKPRALLFSKQKHPTLLYALMAMKHQKYIEFGFVSFETSGSSRIASRFGVKDEGPTLLVFKEDPTKPAVTLQSSDMPQGAVNEILSLHHHMTVPRITSQTVFDDVCPNPGDDTYHTHLCAIFAINPKNTKYKDSIKNLRQAVASAMKSDDQLSDWLKFVFVLDSKQSAFVRSLSGSETVPKEPAIYLIWRKSQHRGYSSTRSAQFLDSYTTLEYGFQKFLAFAIETSRQTQFQREIKFLPIVDELAPYRVTLIVYSGFRSVLRFYDRLFHLNEQEIMLYLVALIVLILSIFSICKSWFTANRRRNQGRQPNQRESQQQEEDNDGDNDVEVEVSYADDEDDGLNIDDLPSYASELKPSTYEEHVLRQKRGHMTIVFLLSRNDYVVANFVKIVKAYEKDPKLHFVYLKLTSYLSWYVELRKSSSAQPPEKPGEKPPTGLSTLRSNNQEFVSSEVQHPEFNAHGTVLSLNGSKHWYCIFVPREGRVPLQLNILPNVSLTTSIGNVTAGGDAGNHKEAPPSDEPQLHSSADDQTLDGAAAAANSSNVFITPQGGANNYYLDSLMHWMDRVCEGQLPRLYVRQWPGLYMRSFDGSDEED